MHDEGGRKSDKPCALEARLLPQTKRCSSMKHKLPKFTAAQSRYIGSAQKTKAIDSPKRISINIEGVELVRILI